MKTKNESPATLAELSATAAAIKAQMKTEGRRLFAEALAATFAAHPCLLAIRWTQYAPHFNDGEPCYFSVHEFQTQMDRNDEGEFEDAGHWFYTRNRASKPDLTIPDAWIAAEEAVEKLYKQAEAIEDTMEDIFGNGYLITAKRDGTIDVEEYEHD